MLRKLMVLLVAALIHSSAHAFEVKYEYPRAFIENKAQFDGRNKLAGSQILYAIDHGPFQVYFTATGITYRLDKKLPRQKWDKSKPISSQQEWESILERRKAVRMESTLIHVSFLGANAKSNIKAEHPLQEYFSYGMGSNSLHYNQIKGYQKLTYQNLYPGIDLEFTFHPEKGFKYQYVVRPGADPSQIQWQYDANVPLRLDGDGNLRIETPFGDIVDHAPISFSADNQKVNTRFTLNQNRISFGVEKYDRTQSLVIDPWVVFPPSPNSNKVWEVETDNAGNVYAYMGDSPFYLRKYNAAGTLQWSYSSSWDSSGFWVGGMVTHPNGDTYITTGSNGEIRKITPSGALAWYNNPNGLTSYEYWSLAFNCDLTKLVVGGSRATFSIPFPVIRGTMMEINLANGGIVSTTVVGFGNITGIPPRIQEASSICASPNGNFYFLTLDTVGQINNQLSTIGFKTPTLYNFDYYIPGYGFGTKQPISAIRANASALYTHDGQTLHKRDLSTGAVVASASIPSGIINTLPIFGTKTQGNGGLDLDNCGNVYVGSGNGVYKFDASLNLVASATTSGAVYDVDVSTNGEVAASGINFVATVSLSACPQTTFVCGNPVAATVSSTPASCAGVCNGTATVNALGGTPTYSYQWSTGATSATINGVCPGTYTVTVTDAAGTSAVQTVTVTALDPLVISVTNINQVSCNGANNGNVSVAVSGATGPVSYLWNTNPPQSGPSISNLASGSYVLTITDSLGCQDTLTTTITEPSPLSLQTNATSTGCNQSTGSAAVIASGGTTPYTYAWNTNPVQTSFQINGLSIGSYTVTVTDANGCTGISQATVQGINAPTVIASSIPACGDSNGSASVSVTGGSVPYSYSWSPSGGNNPVISGVSAGVYQCTITDASGCSQTISINVVTYPLPLANAGSDTTVASGQPVTLNATGGISYVWSPSSSLTCDSCQTTVATPFVTTTYCVTVTDLNGCTASDCMTLTVDEPCGDVFIPSAFSPDGTNDPDNDRFCVYGSCIASLFLQVYDRWGKLVFETNDPLICWDGTYKGSQVNTGVYMYVAKVTLTNGENKVFKGDVTLVR